jgi:hypothetical protein
MPVEAVPVEEGENALEAGYADLAETRADDQAERRAIRDHALQRHADH